MKFFLKIKYLFYLFFIFLSFFIGFIAIKKPQYLKKKASESISSPPLENFFYTKKIDLEDNLQKEIKETIKTNRGKISISFPKESLDANLISSYQIKAKTITNSLNLNNDSKILYLSLNLEEKNNELLKKIEQTTGKAIITPQPQKKELVFSQKAIQEKNNYYLLEYDYSQLEEQYAPSTLKFFWLNPQTSQWEEIPTEIDFKRTTIYAKVDHLSEFSISGLQAQVFSPTFKNWESSLYTGSVNYSYNVETVPGKGGLTPNLNINYVSHRVNNLSHQQKGGWLGPGWDLSLPEIRFDAWTEKENTFADCQNYAGTRKRGPQYSLILQGSEEPLYWVGDQKENSNFIAGKFVSKSGLIVLGYYGSYKGKTQFETDSCNNNSGRKNIITKWVVKGNDGKKYIFDANINNSVADRKIKNIMAPSRYLVTEVNDLSGNKIIFEYQAEVEAGHNITVYPQVIKYNFNNNMPYAAIEFSLKRKTFQPDFMPEINNIKYEEMNFERSLLNEIKVYSNYPNRTLYKTYKFIYNDTSFRYPYKFTGGQWQYTGYDTLETIEIYQGNAINSHKFVPQKFFYEMRSVGFQFVPLRESRDYPPYYSQCERPWGHNVSWSEFKNWVVKNDHCDPDPNSNVSCLCETDRLRLVFAGFEFCSGSNKIGDNEGQSKPNQPQNGCPILAQTIGVYGRNEYAGGGWLMGWETGKAPFLTRVTNGYGGIIEFTYENKINPKKEYAYNRNVVTTKKVYSVNPPTSPISTEKYFYESIPINPSNNNYPDNDGIPERGGGFHKVTVKDETTGLMTTTFYYPLAPKFINEEIREEDTVNNPENNPFWGAPLRQIVHSLAPDENNSVIEELIYSDEFTSYSFIPLYRPDFIDPNLIPTLISEGVGQRVVTTVDKFVPRKKTGVLISYPKNKPFYFDYQTDTNSNDSNFLHTQTRNWYDRFGFIIKTAEYAQVKGFVNFSEGSDITSRREVFGRWEEGDKAQQYSFKLPMAPYLYNQNGPVVSNPPASGVPSDEISLKKFSYVKYVRSENEASYLGGGNFSDYLNNNLLGLVAETFSSNKDGQFENIPETDRYLWTIYKYDQDNILRLPRGLITSVTKKNTYKPADRLKLKDNSDMPDIITTSTRYDQYGNIIEITDGNGNKNFIEYYLPPYPYAHILPLKKRVPVKNNSGNQYGLLTTTFFYNNFWLPEKEIDTNGLIAKAEYDCLGRPQKIYKPTREELITPNSPDETYIYFDYQGDGCGVGQTNISLNNNIPPHYRQKSKITSLDSNGQEKISYLYKDYIFDGLGRTRQTQLLKTKVGNLEKSLISEVVYNNRGLKEKESLVSEGSPINVISDIYPSPLYLPLNNPQWTNYTYDILGRVTTVTDPLQNLTKTEYYGLITRVYDANNSKLSQNQNPTYTETEVNGFNQVIKSIITNIITPDQANYGLMTITTYNSILNVPEATSLYQCQNPQCYSNNNTLLYTNRDYFDRLGRKWKLDDVDLGIWRFAYDANNNLLRQKDAKNQIIDFYYDSLNRLEKKEYPGNPRAGLPVSENRNFVKYIYDVDGERRFFEKKLRMIDPSGETIYNYDPKGRLISQKKRIDRVLTGSTGSEENETKFEYYSNDLPKATILSNNEKIETNLNEYGQIKEILIKEGNTITPFISNCI